jgi:phosphoglycerate dehydrogenase-like enzyme
MSTVLLGYKAGELPQDQIEEVQRLVPHMQVLVTEDLAEIEAALPEIEVAARRFPHDLIPRAPKLRWLQQWGAGADWLLRYPEVARLDFVLTNASGVHAIPISEHILALLFAFARRIHKAVRAQEQRRWERSRDEPIFELAGKTMVLIGVGAIGERTAKASAALGMRVLGVRYDPSLGAEGVEVMYGPDQLLEILPQADFVVLTVPLTEGTRGMIGESELRAMKPTAHIVSIGRGGTIDEEALIRALQEGWIAGAGLDVFAVEPLPASSPLWGIENVIVTAHYAGLTPHYEERAMAIFVDNLRRYVAGEPLLNVVDKQLGY